MKLSDSKRLLFVLCLTIAFMVVEFLGGLLSNSLALMTDAVHLLADVGAIGLGMFTLWASARPAQQTKTFGYLRAEILGALFNGLLLWVIAVFIFVEAFTRLKHPEPVKGLMVIAIATASICVNSFSAWMVGGGHEKRRRLALRAVLMHVLSDLLGALGVLTSGLIVYLAGWYMADPLVSIGVGVLVVYGSWQIVKEGVDILMESVPAHVNIEELRGDLMTVEGTAEVHDLHVWCLSTDEFAMSAHAVVDDHADTDWILSKMTEILERKFNIRHVTLQIERNNRKEREPARY